MSEILDVDLLRFEQGDAAAKRAVVDGVRRSLLTGFVYTSHDLSETLLDEAYANLKEFFALPAEVKQRFVAAGSHGQTGYTGLLVETAASSDVADWKEMLNWGRTVPLGHPLRDRYPHRYGPQLLPEAAVPGIEALLYRFHDAIADGKKEWGVPAYGGELGRVSNRVVARVLERHLDNRGYRTWLGRHNGDSCTQVYGLGD